MIDLSPLILSSHHEISTTTNTRAQKKIDKELDCNTTFSCSSRFTTSHLLCIFVSDGNFRFFSFFCLAWTPESAFSVTINSKLCSPVDNVTELAHGTKRPAFLRPFFVSFLITSVEKNSKLCLKCYFFFDGFTALNVCARCSQNAKNIISVILFLNIFEGLHS